MNEQLLDLDALLPEPRKVRLNGKIYTVKPLRLKNIIELAKVEESISSAQTVDEIYNIVFKVLSDFMPELKKDKDVDLTVEQLQALIEFAQQAQVPTDAKLAQQHTPKKKKSSVEE